jgi:hypothetical protein
VLSGGTGSAFVVSLSASLARPASASALLCSLLSVCNAPASALLDSVVSHLMSSNSANGGGVQLPPMGVAFATADMSATAWDAAAATCPFAMMPRVPCCAAAKHSNSRKYCAPAC